MKKIIAKVAGRTLSFVAKRVGLTNCWYGCYRQEVPQELK
jgi:cyclic lactone autoinducer peptide